MAQSGFVPAIGAFSNQGSSHPRHWDLMIVLAAAKSQLRRTATMLEVSIRNRGYLHIAGSRAPNVLLILTDNVGFWASSPFGGPVPTPTFEQIAKNGLLVNRPTDCFLRDRLG